MARHFLWRVSQAALAAAGSALCLAGAGYQTDVSLPAYASRQAADDLEVTGLPGHAVEYVRLDDLLKLRLVHATVDDDPDYVGVTMHVTGVYLADLAKALGAPKEDDLIDALCTDKYRSHYPVDYIAAHHPIFVLQVDGVSPAEWAAKNRQYDPGPYFVTYVHYVPSFHVLSHADQPALPTNVIRLNFSTQAKTFGAIDPGAQYRENETVQQGFTIAKQNCLRCHFMGAYGGTKSGETWMTLSRKALNHPAAFAAYIRDPKQENPQAEMPGNPQYDEATRAALTAYFRTFSEAGLEKK